MDNGLLARHAMGRLLKRSTQNLLILIVVWIFWAGVVGSLRMGSLHADPLPYTVRTQPYNAWPTTVRGDIRTVGMAGASVGLGDTFIASTANPAGPAMTLQGADLSYTSN